MPEEIYRKDNGKIHRGDIVAFCLVEPYKTIGLKQRYVEKGTACHGTDPLIKQVIAIPGDEVRLTDSSTAVNTIIYPYQTRYTDSNNRKLAVYPRGTYHAQGYWLIGTHSPHSWDSRYFGEVSASQILYKLKPLLI
jgi:conjugative transfer signal peptidase TraF